MSGVYFQLLNPLIFLMFSAGLGLIWRHDRSFAAARLLSFAFAFGAFAFIADFIREGMNAIVATYVTNLLYILAAVYLCAGISRHINETVNWKLLAAMAALTLAALTWFRFVDDSTSGRVLVMNYGVSAMIILTAASTRSNLVRPIYRITAGLLLLVGVAFSIRVTLVIWFTGDTLTGANYPTSVAAMTLHFVSAICALAMAMALFVMFGIEIIRSLTEKAAMDPLTGLPNRRAFELKLTEAECDARAGGQGSSIIMLDIDHFKKINDMYGHVAGDKVLIEVGKILREMAGDTHVPARLGGEEFALLVTNADHRVTRLIAENLRTVIEARACMHFGFGPVTASLGVCHWQQDMQAHDVLVAADTALYAAKKAGRNQVKLAANPLRAAARLTMATGLELQQ